MTLWKKLLIISGTLIGVGAAAAVALHKSDVPQRLNKKLEESEEKGANSPKQLSWGDWKQALNETKSALSDKNLPMLAAGVAFYATLAFFPTVAAFVAVFTLVADPAQINAAVQAVESFMPREMASLINTQLRAAEGKPATNIAVAILSIALALWGASGGVQNMIKATNEAYSVDESRGFVKLKLISIVLVLGGILLGFPLIFLLIVQGDWLTAIGAPEWLANTFLVSRWLVIVAIMAVGLAAFYRYGPDRADAKWQWVSWGAGAAILIWLIGTLLFFFYAQNFGNFSKNYGVFAGIIVLMTWLNLSAFIFLLGAQVNSRLEAQTSSSTTD